MKIIRRSGVEDEFNPQKIEEAIRKANNSVPLVDRLSEKHIGLIVEDVVEECEELKHSPSVEEVQDMVENQIMGMRAFHFTISSGKVNKLSLYLVSYFNSNLVPIFRKQ